MSYGIDATSGDMYFTRDGYNYPGKNVGLGADCTIQFDLNLTFCTTSVSCIAVR